MNVLLNIICVVFGGLMIAFEYAVSSMLMMIAIIGIPFCMEHFKLMRLSLFPFGTAIK